MSTTINTRYNIDLPEWRALQQPLAGSSSSPIGATGPCFAPDMRCRNYQSPHTFFSNSSNVLCSYNSKLDAWNYISSTGVGGTMSQGSNAVFCPTFSPMGTIAAGATVNKVTLTTALPATVIANQLANRGDGLGFIVRIIGNAAGSSGKIEERRIIANSSGTTPTIYFDKPLSFTPATGDRYEFLSGSVLFLNTGTSATANIFRRFDMLTNSYSSLSTTGLIATIPTTHNQLIVLDEQYVPCDRNPGEGFMVGTSNYDTTGDFTKNCLLATGSAANTITGQASNGDSSVTINKFRNYQIRIVEDTAIPTAVGQRRRISSHTAGPSAVYTVATNWTVTPSATCKFVIENDTDRIIGFFGGATATYNYFVSNLGNTAATANTWDTTSWAARAVAISNGGLTWYAFGISPTVYSTSENNIKSSNIFSFRGASSTYDILDISGAATGSWTNGAIMLYNGNSTPDSWVGANDYYYFAYNPHTQGGAYIYGAQGSNFSVTNSQRQYYRFSSINGQLEKVTGPKVAQGSTNGYGANVSFCSVYQDGTTKVAFYNTTRLLSNGIDYFQLMLTF
jgi:hypothetical protein